MEKLLSVLVLMCCGLVALGQGNGKVTGTVLDSANQKPVEFATVALTQGNSDKPLNGSVCDDKGKFSIENVTPGSYKVVISFIGYKTKSIPVTISDKRPTVELGTIKIGSEAEVLQEVTVQGQKALVEERVDRTVYNAENDATTKGGDATDVLKRVPMLSVDMDGNPSLRGNTNIRVLINNKPSTIAASSVADALKQIPADQIKSVEVITSPSARYDAEGSAGIINIITKKNNLEGLTLNVDAGVGTRGSNLGLNGNYRKGKMGFSLGGWGRAGYNITGKFSNNQQTGTTNSTQSADTRGNNIFGRYQLGWDYDIDKKNYMTASIRYGLRNGNNYQDDLHTLLYTPNSFSETYRNVKTTDNSGTVDINFDYTHTYEKPQKEFTFSTQYSRNNRTNNFLNKIYTADRITYDSLIKNINDSYNQEVTFQFDYQTPISTTQLLELGGKEIMRSVSSKYRYFGSDGLESNFVPVTNSSSNNTFNYDQNVTAGYISYTINTTAGYSFKGGTRYEYTTINANFSNPENGNPSIPSYGVFVPSVNVSKKLKNGKMIKVAYNRRIQRPSIQFLNPNVQRSNPLNWSVGNPNLRPEYTNNYEITYNTFIKGTSLNFSGFARNTTGSIQSIRETVNDSIIQTTYRNIGKEDAYGLSVFANVNIGSKFSLNGGSDLYYSILNNNQGTKNQGWIVSGRLFGNYNLTKTWGIQFFGFYRGRQVQLQGTQGGFYMYSIGLKKDLKDKRGSIGFGAENFFTTAIKIKTHLESPTLNQRSVNELHNMSFRINFSYRIGKMGFDNNAGRRGRSVSNDDLKDGGGNDAGGGMGQGGAPAGGGRSGFSGGQRPASKPQVTPAADPNAVVKAEGTWNYTIDSPQGGEGTLTITKDGDKYSGSIFNKRFNSTTPLSSVIVNGNEISFSYDVSFGGNQMTINVKGVINGDALNGNMQVGQFGTFPINATRAQ
jgi:outer membrane receptor protein involved in Fe transport